MVGKGGEVGQVHAAEANTPALRRRGKRLKPRELAEKRLSARCVCVFVRSSQLSCGVLMKVLAPRKSTQTCARAPSHIRTNSRTHAQLLLAFEEENRIRSRLTGSARLLGGALKGDDVCVRARTCVCAHLCVCVRACVRACMCVCVCMCV